MELLRWIPLIATIGSLPVAGLIIRNLTASDWRYLLAFGAFAVLPRRYIWLVGGCGLTRSLGFLLALGATIVLAVATYVIVARLWWIPRKPLAVGGLGDKHEVAQSDTVLKDLPSSMWPCAPPTV
jgi:hypothetical protein